MLLEHDAKNCPDGLRKRDLEQMVADIHHRLGTPHRKAENEATSTADRKAEDEDTASSNGYKGNSK